MKGWRRKTDIVTAPSKSNSNRSHTYSNINKTAPTQPTSKSENLGLHPLGGGNAEAEGAPHQSNNHHAPPPKKTKKPLKSKSIPQSDKSPVQTTRNQPSYSDTHAKPMRNIHPNLKVIFIGGSSHVGKSTVSEPLATTLGWTYVSTDSLARHPGKPWKPAPEKVPDHVAEHYLDLSFDELIEDLLRHYKVNVWPKVAAIVAAHSNDSSTTGIVVEGSALWPKFAINLDPKKDRRNMAHGQRRSLSAKNSRRKPL